MQRRDFITILGGAAATWPLSGRAQQPPMSVIGYIDGANADARGTMIAAFRQGLSDVGFSERQNASIEFRFADTNYDRLPALAADLVQRNVSVIAASGIPAAVAAKGATTTIPIIFYSGGDAVAAGLVASLHRPGGNLTGVVNLNVELGPKRLELLHEVVPSTSTIALLINPQNPNAEAVQQDTKEAARNLGLKLHIITAQNDREIDAAFTSLQRAHAGALLISADTLFVSRTDKLAALALRNTMPAIHSYPEFAAAGGLMSYGGSITEGVRLVGSYVGRILRGRSQQTCLSSNPRRLSWLSI